LSDMLQDGVPKNQYNHRVALYGMGGVGKTQTAIAYVYANKAKYEKIFWISATSEAALLSGYQEIATSTQCTQESNPKRAAKMVIAWLERQDNWLIVIDNLDHIEIVKDYLPDRSPSKHTLITTRNPNANGIPARGLEVPLPQTDEGIEMICTLSEMDVEIHKEEARQVVEELQFLPLALDQAASYVRQVAKSFSKFLVVYQKYPKDLRKWTSDGNRQYDHSLATTWSISFEFIRKREPPTANLFQYLSFLNPDGILMEFVELGKEALGDDIREIVSDPFKLQRALLNLEKHSLIRWSRETDTISIHRLIQEVTKDEMTEHTWKSYASTVIVMCDIIFPETITNENRVLYRRYQGQTVSPLLKVGSDLKTKTNADVCIRIAKFLTAEGKFKDSEQLGLQALEVHRSLNGVEHVDSLSVQIILGDNAWRSGNFPKAAEILQVTVATSTRVLGDEHPSTLSANTNLALTYWNQGRWSEAAELQEMILRIRGRILGEEHPETLSTMNNLGNMYSSQGRWSEAAELQEKILGIRGRVLGEEHSYTLNTMNNLALTYRNQGRWSEAAELQEKELRIIRRVLGEEDLNTLISMNNLANTYRNQGRWSEAAELQEKVLRIRRRVLGEKDLNTLISMNNLGMIYSDQRRFVEAAELLEKSLHGKRSCLGENHPSTLSTMINLGATYREQGKLADAIELLDRTMNAHTRLQLSGDGMAGAMTELGVAYSYQGRHEEAAELHQKALTDRRESLGERHPDVLVTTYCLAEVYRHQERWEDAAELQEKAVATMKEVMGEQHPKTLKAVESLRLIREGLGGISLDDISSPSVAEPGDDPKVPEPGQDLTVRMIGEDTV
jgi:tetratricopeptide (TPR) repeat protein